MKNCDFRNAVIGKNGLKDPVWPFLNESNYIYNRKNRPVTTSQSHLDSVVTDEAFVHVASTSRPNDLTSQFNNVESREQKQIENNFPELSKSVKMKKKLNRIEVAKNINSKFVITKVSPSNNVSRKIKVPKFRNEISVSLSSLIKPPVVKSKALHKKIIIKKRILCGNKLDGDRPIRRKGKANLTKKKYLTQYKKGIILSRSLKKKCVYNQNFHKAKCLIPSMLNCLNNVNIDKLETLLGSLSIDKQKTTNQESSSVQDNSESKISTKEIAKTLLHSKKFKKYCDNVVTTSLLKNAESLVVRLRNLQDKQHAKDPAKTFAKRRYLCGFRETKRFILCDSVKAVIVATDLEIDSDLPSGFPLNEITNLTTERDIPLVYVGKVKQLRYWTIKKQNISIISILRYEGAEQLYNDFILSWKESKKAYENVIKHIETYLPKSISSEEEISPDVEQEIRNNIISKMISLGSQ